jgi:hypothetical protein
VYKSCDTGGNAATSRRTSCGISTQVGPYGGVSAVSHAAASALGICEALRTSSTDFTTSRKLAFWSRNSWR